MKNFKIKSIFFSLMAIAMVTVLLSSCERNEVLPALNEIQIDKSEDEVIHFKLPASLDNMSDEALIDLLRDKTKAEILDMAVEVLENNIESRWCTTPTIVYTACQVSHNCGGRRYVSVKKRYCDSSGWYYYLSFGSCC